MKKFLIGLFVFFVVVITAAIVLIPHLVNIEQYRGRIETAIRQKTGFEPSLGTMTLKILPSPALRIHPLGLKDPQGRMELTDADLSIRAQLRPLLHKKLVIDRIEVLHPHVTLHRHGDVLALPALPAQPEASSQRGQAAFGVEVDNIAIHNGRIDISGNRQIPAWGLSGVSVSISPKHATFTGRAKIDAGGTVSWTGTLGREAVITVKGIAARALEPWLPGGVVRSGTITAGTITVSRASSVQAHLDLANIKLLSGTEPLKRATADLTITRSGEAWRLAPLKLSAGGATIQGAGSLIPTLDLRLKVRPTPIGDVLAVARAVFPLPLTLAPPGSFAGSIRIWQQAGSPVRFSATGMARAATATAAPGLPGLEKVRTAFALHPDGSLVLAPFAATAFDGALSGRLQINRIDPPGTLRFTGTLKNVNLAKALHAFSPDAAAKVSGLANANAAIAVDLSRPKLDARAISGKLTIAAHNLVFPGWDIVGALHDLGSGKTSLIGMLASFAGGSAAAPGTTSSSGGQGTFGRATATITLNQIPWKLSDLSLQAEDLTARGHGTFDPVGGRVDLDLTAHVSKLLTAQLVKRAGVLKNLKDAQGRLVVPLKISGPAAKPKITFDLSSALSHRGSKTKKPGEKTKGIEDLINQLLQKH